MPTIRFPVRIRSRFRRRDWTEYCARPSISRSSSEQRVKVELKVARDGRKRYTGMLRRTDGESIEMDVDNFSVSIKLAEIGRARLAPFDGGS